MFFASRSGCGFRVQPGNPRSLARNDRMLPRVRGEDIRGREEGPRTRHAAGSGFTATTAASTLARKYERPRVKWTESSVMKAGSHEREAVVTTGRTSCSVFLRQWPPYCMHSRRELREISPRYLVAANHVRCACRYSLYA